MNNDPNQHNERLRQQELARQQEAQRLRQETDRVGLAQRRSKFVWMRNTIGLLVGSLEILLGIRFFLRVTGANPENLFSRFILALSEPFMAPFSTLFVSPTDASATQVFDVNLLIAMVVYAVLGAIAIAIVNYLQGRAPY